MAVPARSGRTVAELVQGERAPALAPDEVAESVFTVEGGEFACSVSPQAQELALGARDWRAAGTGASGRELSGGGVQARLSPRQPLALVPHGDSGRRLGRNEPGDAAR